MIREEVLQAIKKHIPKDVAVTLTVPEDSRFGHYATNVAFALAKREGKAPFAIAERIASAIKSGVIREARAAAPGFINFFLTPEVLHGELQEILKQEKNYGRGKKRKESVSLDYLDANPTGPVHLGHARSGFFGDVLSNVLEFSGYRVSREFYVNNAKSSGQIKSLGATALGKGEEYRHNQLLALLKKPPVKAALKKMKNEADAGFYIAKLIQKENEAFLKKTARIAFDLFFEEQAIYQKKLIEKTLGELEKRGEVYRKEGAMWFKASAHGDREDRVFVRSDGTPTYILPDLAYHLDRLRTRGYDRAIDIFGADHHGYGPRLKGALEAFGIDQDRVEVLITQTVRLTKEGKEFKMSKRKGVFVTLEALIKEVGLDAARFFFLTTSLNSHFDFDIGLAKERSNKNPVYYLQYALVRARSILDKVQMSKLKFQKKADLSLLNTPDDAALLFALSRFPEVLADAASDYAVHRLTQYTSALARAFHNFYEKERIIGASASEASARLALVKGSIIVFENLFRILGISAPSKM